MIVNSFRQNFVKTVSRETKKPEIKVQGETFNFRSKEEVSTNEFLDTFKGLGEYNKMVDRTYEAGKAEQGGTMVSKEFVELFNMRAFGGYAEIMMPAITLLMQKLSPGEDILNSNAAKLKDGIITIDCNSENKEGKEKQTDLMRNEPSYRIYVGIDESKKSGSVYVDKLGEKPKVKLPYSDGFIGGGIPLTYPEKNYSDTGGTDYSDRFIGFNSPKSDNNSGPSYLEGFLGG